MVGVTLEFHFPANWAIENEVDILWSNGSEEQSYGRLAQNRSITQQTYPGHCWILREVLSRAAVLRIVAAEQLPGTPQRVAVGDADCGELDPLRSFLWRVGSAPREACVKTCAVLLKALSNVSRDPANVKFRTLKAGNAHVAAALNTPGALALLSYAGFEQHLDDDGGALLHLAADRPLQPLRDALAQLQRLHNLLHGLAPPPGPSHTQAGSSSPSSSTNGPQPSHRCACCHAGIDNDLRQQMAGSGEIGGWRSHGYIGNGEYRFHCEECKCDLCGKCYDKWKACEPNVHALSHSFTIVAPITTPWGNSSYGPTPPPPPVTSRNRRGPFG